VPEKLGLVQSNREAVAAVISNSFNCTAII
jgi:hypothetical protein